MKYFLTIWFGELISSIGSGMTAFAISIYVYQLTGSAACVSVAALLAYLPTILLSPLGGILADRYDRRLMMLLGDLLSAVGIFIIFISVQTGNGGMVPTCIGLTISSIFVSLLEPAYKATVTDLLTGDEYAKASGMVQIAGSSKYLISPVVAGLILHVADIRAILIFDMGTFFVTVATITAVRKQVHTRKTDKTKAAQHTKKSSLRMEFREGLHTIVSDKTVKSLVILMGFMCFFIAFLQTLMTPMVLAFTDSKTLGTLESISAVGMLIGSVVIGVFSIKKNYSKVLMISLLAAGIFMAMAGTTTNLYLLCGFCILFFAALPFVNTCADVMIRIRIPNELQGRAWGIIGVLTQIGYVIAYAICGVLADYVFNPLLRKDGILAGSIGRIIGTGEGRGIGLMLILAGIMMAMMAVIIGSNKNMKECERSQNELIHC